jgi:ABC-type transport system involved in multi-copper enzyme maturation permease subunit
VNVRFNFNTLLQLIGDTFRQSFASGVCWMMFVVTAICVALCLSVTVSGDISLDADDEPVLFLPRGAPAALTSRSSSTPKASTAAVVNPEVARRDGIETLSGCMSLAFGAVNFPVSRARRDAVFFLELVLSWGVAGTFGLLMTLVWTAGFVPAFLDPGAASVLLAKPVARWQLLLGKYVGVLSFVGFHVVLFVALTWLALGIRTHVWNVTYWWCIPLLLLQFAIFYSFSVLLAVISRSTVACVFGSVLYWLLAWGINYGYVMARSLQETQYLPAGSLALAQVAYEIFPKPIDAGLILFNALGALGDFDKPAIFALLESGHAFSPCTSILSSVVLTVVLLGTATYEFSTTDY